MSEGRSILVTGGACYVGSHCCKLLSQAGYLPVAFDDLSNGHREFVKWGPLFEGDIRDAAALSAAFSEYRPLAVLHLASLILVGESARDPKPYRSVNLDGTRVLLGVMRDAGLNKLVFSSSAAVYGDCGLPLIPETAEKHPASPYGETKLLGEQAIEEAAHDWGLRALRLRYFNAAGADPGGGIGEDHDPETHLIPLILDAALGRRSAVTVFGSDYLTADGTAVWDYVHVSDLAAAHLAALEHLLAGGQGAAVNLGSGRGASVMEVIAGVEALAGRSIKYRTAARRPGDPVRLVADPAKASRLLGWRARHSGLEEILADAWRWHQSRFARGHAT